jgi:membrane-associated phospholipid phosphatase
MSEKNELLSKRVLLIIGITSLAILLVGVILDFAGLNEEFYVDSSAVQSIFKAITYLGEPVVFIVIVAILFIAYDKKYAKNIAACLLFSTYFNGLFKELIEDPRPPVNYDSNHPDFDTDFGAVEVSYGFPSGHSQTAVSFWGYLGYEFDEPKYELKNYKIPIVPVALSIVIFLVAISRIILGVHDLEDIIGGLLIGIGLLLAFIYVAPNISERFSKLSLVVKLIIVIAVSLALFLIGTFLFPRAGFVSVIAYTPPLYPDGAAFGQVGGVTMGFGLGCILEQEYIKYDPSALTNKKKLVNVVIGLLILILVFIPLEYLLEIDSAFYRFARYAITGFILAFVVPFIFVKLDRK